MDDPTSDRPATEAERKIARALIALAREQLKDEDQASGEAPSADESADMPDVEAGHEGR